MVKLVHTVCGENRRTCGLWERCHHDLLSQFMLVTPPWLSMVQEISHFLLGQCPIRSHWTLKKCLLCSVWVIQAPTRPRVTFKWTPQAKFILWQTKFVPVSSDQLCDLCCFSEYFSRTQKQRDSVLNKPNLEEKALRRHID